MCNKFLFNSFPFQDEIESRGAVVFDYTDLLSDPGKLLLSNLHYFILHLRSDDCNCGYSSQIYC